MKLSQSLLYYFAAMTLFVILPFQSCKEQTDLDVNEDEFVEIEIPDAYKVPAGARIDAANIFEKTIPVMVTRTDGRDFQGLIRVRAVNDQTLMNFAVSRSLMRDLDLTPDYWINNLNPGNNLQPQVIGACIKGCNDDWEKGEGRGWCKVGCWAEFALKVATLVLAVVNL